VSNHFLYYNGDSHDAFCLNPYLSGGNYYTEGTFNGEWYAADYEAALKYIAMYNEGYPTGFDDRVRKLAVQMAIFNTSQMGEDYAPPNKAAYWYSLMFNGSEYYNALLTLWYQAESYTMPQTGALLADRIPIYASNFDYMKFVDNSQYHVVKSGDTLSAIARKYHVSVKQICDLNGIKESSILSIGKRLKLRP
jgi:hypothetical protein